jgi:hypothetical protein
MEFGSETRFAGVAKLATSSLGMGILSVRGARVGVGFDLRALGE